MSWVKMREKMAAISAVVFMLLMGLFIAAAYGIQIPFLTNFMRRLLGW
jgi:hypothetical protein